MLSTHFNLSSWEGLTKGRPEFVYQVTGNPDTPYRKAIMLFLLIVFSSAAFVQNLDAHPTCVQHPNDCRHTVNITNSSNCPIELVCIEVGCDGQAYPMGTLASGQTFYGAQPSAYNAIFKIKYNGSYIYSFPQLPANGTCQTFNFEWNPTTLTDPGTISGGGTFCGTNPPNQNLIGTPASGGGGPLYYQWQYKKKENCGNWSGWINWETSQSVYGWNYAGPGATASHQFRRLVISHCGDWASSNIITFDVKRPLTDPGTITGGGTFCGNNPGDHDLVGTAASGGCGGDIEYLWQYQYRGPCSNSWSGWYDWSTAQSVYNWDNYTGTSSHRFRRLAKRAGCGNWIPSNIITFDIQQPLTDPGTISGGGTFCGTNPPNQNLNGTVASGGCGGAIQYQWQYQKRSDCGNWTGWINWETSQSVNGWNYAGPGATASHRFRRGARRVGCGDWIYSNTINFDVQRPLTDPGNISGGGTFCGNIPGNQNLTGTAASGGCGGAIQYQWQYQYKADCGNWSGWTNWQTVQSVGIWNYTGKPSHRFRRAAKRSGCGNWIYSNTITFDVHQPLTNPGTITGGGTFCNYITNSQNLKGGNHASGGCGGSIEYLWQYRKRSACSTTWGSWNNWLQTESVNWSYSGDVDHQFRRGAKRAGCGDYLFTDLVTFEVEKPLTDPGIIGGNESKCGSYDPAVVGAIGPAKGGCSDAIIYQWQKKTTGAWMNISGATGLIFDPGNIHQTTAYRRAAKRGNCGDFIFSNVVTKTVLDFPVVSQIIAYPDECGANNGSIKFLFPDNPERTGIEFSLDGGATYQATVADNSGSIIYNNLPAGVYHLFVRWDNDECPKDLGNKTIGSDGGDVADAGTFTPGWVGSCETDYFDPPTITPSNASCTDGSNPTYQWQIKSETGGQWTNINNANGASYNPPSTGIGSTWYRRLASCPCQKDVPTTNIFDVHVYHPKAGNIVGNESKCGSYDPAQINNVDPATDGRGNLTYRWQKKVAGGNWTTINGATGADYDPPTINETTQYRRQAKFADICTEWKTSNLVTKTVSSQTPGTACDDYNPNTVNDVIQADGCSCAGTFDPCIANGGDSDGDEICDNDDCAPLDPNLPAPVGSACNDGNPNTIDDVILADGCSCAGTPAVVCVNITNGGKIGFGQNCLNTITVPCNSVAPLINNCANPSGGSGNIETVWLISYSSCDYPTSSADDIAAGLDPHWSMIPGATGLTLNPGVVTEDACYIRCSRREGCDEYIESNIISLKTDCTGNQTPDCNDITIAAGVGSIHVTGLDGAPVSSLQIFNSSWGTEYNCFANCGSSSTVNLSAGTYYVYVKYYDAGYNLICEVNETLIVNGGGSGPVDGDGDGVPAGQDCDDSDPGIPATPGTACDDGNANTTNDEIQNDGCTCSGEPAGGGNGSNPDCSDVIISSQNGVIMVTNLDGAPISSLQIFNVSWQQEFSCFADCDATETIDLPEGEYYVYAKYYTASYTLICEAVETVNITDSSSNGGGSGPCDNTGGDSDGDGTCDDNDCQPYNSDFPATPGDSCDDGNSNTINDVVSADGCGCAGEIDNGNNGSGCSNITISSGNNIITISGLDNAPVSSVQIFSSDWTQELYTCFGDCNPVENINIDAGSYIVLAKLYSANWMPECEVMETVAVVQALSANQNFEVALALSKYEEHTEIIWSHNQGERVLSYEVEHSVDNIQFESIADYPSEGGTNLQVYNAYDLEPATGDNYYRIRLNLTDNSTAYSDVKMVHFTDLIDFTLFPNPANKFVKINLEDIVGKEGVYITIFNNLGVTIKRFELDKVSSKYYQMDIRDLREGHYTVWLDIPSRKPIAKQLIIGKL
ncbi:MAG: T9SS type A sorting domain-containing protein [Bacteroidota bacterium]